MARKKIDDDELEQFRELIESSHGDGHTIGRQTMVADIRDIAMSLTRGPLRLKGWDQCSEAEKELIEADITSEVKQAVERCVEIIAADGRETVLGIVESVTRRNSQIKAVLQVRVIEENRGELFEHEGSPALLLLVKPAVYGGGSRAYAQPDLPLDERGGDDDEGGQGDEPQADIPL